MDPAEPNQGASIFGGFSKYVPTILIIIDLI
jgi:hypothetical protein